MVDNIGECILNAERKRCKLEYKSDYIFNYQNYVDV